MFLNITLEDIAISKSYLQHRFITRFKPYTALKCLCKRITGTYRHSREVS